MLINKVSVAIRASSTLRLEHPAGVSANHFLRRGYAILVEDKKVSAKPSHFDEETDVLIIGSGGAGWSAALRSHALSLRSMIVEKADVYGGTTATSGGGMWIPNNYYLRAAGKKDSVEEALDYMERCIKDAGPASTKERKMSFLINGPKMVDFLRECGFQGRASGEYPNYYPDLPGGDVSRSLEPKIFNQGKLGSDRKLVRVPPGFRPPMHTDEASRLVTYATGLSNAFFAVRKIGPRILRRLLGQHPVGMGQALISQLMYLNKKQGSTVWWRNSPIQDLIVEDGKVVGAVINHEGNGLKRVRAHKGVLLSAGGFSRNKEMREKYQEGPIGPDWTSAPADDTGEVIRLGAGIKAQLALMDDAWWGPSILTASGARYFLLSERALPHSIIVDQGGSRFMNEAQSYTDAGHAMFRRNREVKAIPAWFIFDTNHRNRYPLADVPPRFTPKWALTPNFLHKANTLDELARSIGIDPSGLARTVTRFNEMAKRGVDEYFKRGGNKYDRWFGDKKVKPNPNLGAIEKGPFYAVKVWPGDLGTKGGLLTDEAARVIGEDGKVIPGLYAAGNNSASVMGRTYPGPGSTLGPALTFGYVAANSMAGQKPL